MFLSTDKVVIAINENKFEDFIDAAKAFLQECSNKKELDSFVEIFTHDGARAMVSRLEADTAVEIGLILRDKIYEITFKNNELPEYNYVRLYLFYKTLELPSHEQLSKFKSVFQSALPHSKEYEYLFLSNMLFVCDFLSCNKNAFFDYLKRTFLDATDYLHHAGQYEQFIALIKYIDFTFEEFEIVAKEIWSEDVYIILSPYQRRTFYNWCLHSLWNIPRFFNNPKWVGFYEHWKRNFYGHLERGEIDEAMYVHFYIYHKMGNSFQEQSQWRMLNEELSRPAAKAYKEWAEKNSLQKCKEKVREDGKIKIALVKDRFVENSPFKVEYSVLKNLAQDEEFKKKYELTLYSMNYFEKSADDPKSIQMIESLGFRVVNPVEFFKRDGYHNNHLIKAVAFRQKLLDDDIDIMINPGSHYDITDFLFCTRAAPKQIFWCHGNFEYDIDGIDKRITHIHKNSPQKQSDYLVEHFDFETEEKYLTGNDPEEEYKKKAKEIKNRYPEKVLLGTIGRLIKVDSEPFLMAVAQILKESPSAIYLACGSGNTESILEKIERIGIDKNRFVFTGWVDPHVYGHVIDVYLNTFPEPSGQAAVEFLEKNKNQFFVGYDTKRAEESAASANRRFVLDALWQIEIIKNIGKDEWCSRYTQDEKTKSYIIDESKIKELESKALEIKKQYDGKVVLGCIGHLEDMAQEEYLKALKIIMQECPDTIYLACGLGDIQEAKKRFLDFEIDIERVEFVGWADPHVCIFLIDIYLNFESMGSLQSFFDFKENNFWQFSSNKSFNETLDDYIASAIGWVELIKHTNKGSWIECFEWGIYAGSRVPLSIQEKSAHFNGLLKNNKLKNDARLTLESNIVAKQLEQMNLQTNIDQSKVSNVIFFDIGDISVYDKEHLKLINIILSNSNSKFIFFSSNPEAGVPTDYLKYESIKEDNFIHLDISQIKDTFMLYELSIYLDLQGKNVKHQAKVAINASDYTLAHPLIYESHNKIEPYFDQIVAGYAVRYSGKEKLLRDLEYFYSFFTRGYTLECRQKHQMLLADEMDSFMFAKETATLTMSIMQKELEIIGYSKDIVSNFGHNYYSLPPAVCLASNLALLASDKEKFSDYFTCINNYQSSLSRNAIKKLSQKRSKTVFSDTLT